MARVSNYDAVELEGQIGPRGSTLVNSSNRGLVQNWLVAQGIPSSRVKTMKLSTLYKCYNRPQYLNAVLAHAEGLFAAPDAKRDEEREVLNDLADESAVVVSETRGTATAESALGMLGSAIKMLAGEAIDEDRVIALIREHAPRSFSEIVVTLAETGAKVNVGAQHKLFERLLKTCAVKLGSARLNVWLSGPAGSGKTTAAEAVARALGLKFTFNGAIDTEYKLLGFTDAQGRIVSRPFRDAYENGGVYLFDEIDRSLPGALLAFNAALANGYCDFPDGPVSRHPDCIVIAAANTYGLGGTSDYVGAMKQDAAFLDRFVVLDWPVDEDLERAICPDSAWCDYVQAVRQRARQNGLRVVVSPRASLYGAALLAQGFDRATVCAMALKKGMSAEQWESVR